MMAKKSLQLGRAVEWPDSPEKAELDRVPNPQAGHQLRGALHRAGIHLALPGDGTAGFRASGDRLCAGPVAAGIQVAETLCRELPQSRRLPRGLHGHDRQAHRRPRSSRNSCASAATGIRAAASRSTCSGRPANCRRACGCPTRASRPIAGGDSDDYFSMCHDPSQSWDGGFALRLSMRLIRAIDGPSPGIASSDALNARSASSHRRSR